MRHLLALALLLAPLIAEAHLGHSEPDWVLWKQKRDTELEDVHTSYLSVLDLKLLPFGGSLYLPLGGPRNLASWRKEAPGKPMAALSSRPDAKDDQIDIQVSSTSEFHEVAETQSSWTTPDGMIVTFEKTEKGPLLFLRDPLKDDFKGFKGSAYFPFEPKAVVNGKLSALTKAVQQSVMTTQGRPRQVWLVGNIEFSIEGRKYELKAYSLGAEPNPRELFVPFLDATNGVESYAGGRYIEAKADASGNVIVDFNRSYNPYCARNHVFSCIKVLGKPIESRILAGEKTPKKR